MIKHIAEFFFLSLLIGISPLSFLAKTKDMGKGFLQLIEAISFGCLMIIVLLRMEIVNLLPPLFFTILLYYRQKEIINVECITYRVLKILSLFFFAGLIYEKNWINVFYLISSALFIGSNVYAMLLGHWYLVVPKLSSKPLLIILNLIALSFFLKLFLSFWGGYQFYGKMEQMINSGEMLGSYWWPYFLASLRFLFGYFIIGILGLFTFKLAKIHSMQSATGILYIMVFFMIIGELISEYFFFSEGIPL